MKLTVDQATSMLQGLTTTEWVLIAIAVIAALALAIVGFLWWRRRRAAPKAAPVAAAPARPTVPLGKQLVADARKFRRGLPAPARRCLDAFHPIVVLGTESSGKAAIIERFAGVAQRRVELGAGAELAGGQLRCVLGGDAIVFDPSEEVVRAPRELVDAGLTRALAPQLRRRPPIVVVCVSPEALDKLSEPQLAELGSALRAKLDVIAALRDEPAVVRVVVSDVPGFARFDALFRLLQLPGIPAVLTLERVDDDAVRGALLGYADEIGTALTQLTPHETLELVGFLEALPQLSGALSVLLGELFAPAGDLTPHLDGLYLLPAQGGPNPLAIPESLLRPAASPLLKHRLIALSLAVAVAGVLLAGYRRDAERWDHAAAAAKAYELKAEHELDLRLAIRDYAGSEPGGLTDRLRPGFFVDGPRVVACSFVEQVRQDYLVGSLAHELDLSPEQRQPERALYLAAALYAGHDDDLGHLVNDRVEEWAEAVGPQRPQLIDYLRMARRYRDEHWLERLAEVTRARGDDRVAADLARFLGWFAPGRTWSASEIVEAGALAKQLRPQIQELARFGAAERILDTPPLDRLAPTYKVCAARFAFLSQLWDNRVELDRLLETVIEGAPAAPPGAPRSFRELSAALSPLLTDAAAAAPSRFVIDGHEYTVDRGGFAHAVRGDQIEQIVSGFVTRMPGEAAQLFFPDPAQWNDVALAVQWPAGTAGAETHTRIYQREIFESDVKPTVVAIHKLLGQLADRPALGDRLAQALGKALDAYAGGYEHELERLVSSFHVELSSEVAAQRVLRALAGARSPMRELLRTVAHDAGLGLANDKTGQFDAMAAIEDRFGALAPLFVAGKTGEPFVAYQDVLRELAMRLAAPQPASAGKPSDAPGAAGAALTVRLSAAGALALSAVTGAPDKASPLAALDAWLADKALPDELAGPFRLPVRAAYGLGAHDVEGALAAWDRDIEAAVDADLFARFPFDRRSGDDLDPQTLTDWLHPKRGRLASDLEPAVAGLVARTRGWDGRTRHQAAHPCTGDEPCVRVPGALLATLDRLAAASGLLWDDAGKPRPLEVDVTPRPFTLSAGTGPLPELVRLTVGDATVFYFNQRPKRTTLALDWTRDQTASLSVQIKQDGSLSLTPPAVVASGTPWALFHLLQQADRHGSTYTWHIRLGPSQLLAVSYDVVDRTVQSLGGAKLLVSRGPQ
ncbi:MAG: hypothetical protein E6J90_30290 [Deltaproteobacteria bacterium]|nr:MAG: hypothetical protein E6J90_30290 [Deltaproteobacteria bacterium]